ncbi:MAG: S8 family serine peptidase [Pseudomonadota bacterium]
MRAVFTTLALLVLTACAAAEPPQPEWRLLPATVVAGDEHLIVTVPLDDPARLAATAAALEADHPITLVSEWPLAAISVHCYVFRLTAGQASAAEAIDGLSRDERVRTVQPMQDFGTLTAEYTDELFDLQDGLHAINGPRMHGLTTGRGVRVAVIDTLADADHPDLATRVQIARDFVGNREQLTAEVHGTAIAGVIAADASNRQGMVGVAPDAEILVLRACWEEPAGSPGRCTSFSLARALNFALGQDVDVVNLSLGGPHDPLMAELVEAMLARGVVVVAAHGEDAAPRFPASHPGVIAATSALASGAPVGVPAPGTDILSAAPGNGFDFYSGSSVAAAHVSGIAALLLESRPELSPAALREALTAALRVPPDTVTVDACAALQAATASSKRC